MISTRTANLRDGRTVSMSCTEPQNPGAAVAGVPFVLLHGAGGNELSFSELMPHLTDFHAFAPSLPGRCGSSGALLTTVADAAEWLGEVLDSVDITRPVLFGHSFGGAIAIEYALRHPVHALVLSSTGAKLRVHPAILEDLERCVRSGEHAPLDRHAFGKNEPEKGFVERIERVRALTPTASALADWQAANAFDRMFDVETIEANVRVLCGGYDALTPLKYAEFLSRKMPNTVLRTASEAGHMLPDEYPEFVASELRAAASMDPAPFRR